MTYATDGRCHNSEPGTFNHECGRPATWIGTDARTGFQSGFCNYCKEHGWERHGKTFQPSAHTELTPVGEQYVIPGCEKHDRPAGSQLKLWER